MAFPQVVNWGLVLLGVASVGMGARKWRTGGGRQDVLMGVMFIAQAAFNLGSGWVRYAAGAVLAPIFVSVGRRFFTDRDPLMLWFGLPFLVMILAIAAIETVFDHITVWQRLVMGAIAAVAAAALVTTVVRLVQARRARRALG